MKTLPFKLLAVLLVVLIASSSFLDDARGAGTVAVLDGGVCVNEILIDPSGDSASFDTDNNGTADDLDEFLELYNNSTETIDISGWEVWDSGSLLWFTFPGSPDDSTTTLAASAYVVVVAGVQTGGSLPSMTNPESIIFDAGNGSQTMNNTMDNVVLYDPGADEYVQLVYNGDAADDPTSSYSGFSSMAVRVGPVEDFGSDEDGKSLTRYPSGDTYIIIHDSIPGAGNASPTIVTQNRLGARSETVSLEATETSLLLVFALAGLVLLLYMIRRWVKFHEMRVED